MAAVPQQTLFGYSWNVHLNKRGVFLLWNKQENLLDMKLMQKQAKCLGKSTKETKIVRANETAEESKKIYLNSERRFVKVYENVLKAKGEAQDKLTDREVAVLIALADFVCYNSCCLREGGHGNGKVLTQADLAERLGMKYNNFNAVFCSLRNKESVRHIPHRWSGNDNNKSIYHYERQTGQCNSGRLFQRKCVGEITQLKWVNQWILPILNGDVPKS